MIKLDDVIQGMELIFDDTHYYYHVDSDSIVMLTDEDIRYAEGDRDPEDAPEWQRASIWLACEFIESYAHEFISLPGKYEIDEYGMMEAFIETVEDTSLYNELSIAIGGRGAFRRFKDAVHCNGLGDKWYAYRDRQYVKVAKKWCEDNNIEYEKE